MTIQGCANNLQFSDKNNDVKQTIVFNSGMVYVDTYY